MSGSKQRIGVLIDGFSRHREFSLRSGEAIVGALSEQGHDAHPVFVDRDLDLALRQGRFEAAFLATRGRYGSDGCLQGLLEMIGLPYTGSGVLATALAMNQAKTRDVFRLRNLPTAPGYVIHADSERKILDHHGSFGFPVVVSPTGIGLSVGACLASDELELEAAVEEAFRVGDEVLVERFIEGRVVAVAMLDGTPLGAMDLGPLESYLEPGLPGAERGEPRLRSRFAVARYRSLLRIAQQAAEAINVEGPALVELVVSDRLNEVVRGIDAAPALAPSSLYARIAASAGFDFNELCEEVLRGARLRAHGKRRERRAIQSTFDGPERRNGPVALPH